jgi:hypothetical protein
MSPSPALLGLLALVACTETAPDVLDDSDGLETDSDVDSAMPCPEPSDDPPTSPGPYDHRLHVATSTDGLNFIGDSAVLLEHASAPDAVIGPDGETWVYFVNGVGGQDALFIAKHDDQGSLEVFDCVRLDGEIDDQAVDPDVLQLADGSYRLFYNTLVSPVPGSTSKILSATSEDGVHFQREAMLIEAEGVLNPSAVQLLDGGWVLTYANEVNTFVATSDDGLAFSETTTFPAGIPELTYLPNDGSVRLYNAEMTGFKVRSSVDGGQGWVDVAGSAPGVQDPSVLRLDADEWRLYYRSAAQ